MKALPLPYCADQVRAHDRDRFIASLLMPAPIRPALWAIYAFNIEIAKTREVVSDTTLGLIRLQWWRDALTAWYERGEVYSHPVLQDLTAAITAHNVPRDDFDALLYAREFDLEDVLPANIEGLNNYADFTAAPLLRLAARIAGEDAAHPSLKPVAQAYALAGILRAVPFHASQRRCLLPENLLRLHAIDPETLYAGKMPEALPQIIRAVHDEAAALLKSVKPEGRTARITAKQASLFLSCIRAAHYNIFDDRVRLPPLLYPLRLAL